MQILIKKLKINQRRIMIKIKNQNNFLNLKLDLLKNLEMILKKKEINIIYLQKL